MKWVLKIYRQSHCQHWFGSCQDDLLLNGNLVMKAHGNSNTDSSKIQITCFECGTEDEEEFTTILCAQMAYDESWWREERLCGKVFCPETKFVPSAWKGKAFSTWKNACFNIIGCP